MSFVGLFGKRTRLGLASAVAALLLCVMLGALLVVKGALPSRHDSVVGLWQLRISGVSRRLHGQKGRGRGGTLSDNGGAAVRAAVVRGAGLFAARWIFKVTACGSPARCLAAVFSRVCCAVEKSGKSRPNGKRLRR